MATNPISSLKHTTQTRPHIPSKEEEGYEDANPLVLESDKNIEVPKNPVVHRGQDPELFWLNKYGNDDRDETLKIDIRSLYRHEHIAPENIIKNLYKIVENENPQLDFFSINETFGNALNKDEIEKVSEYYKHQNGWTNRLIQGDSLLVMTSLLAREGLAKKVQCIYIDPPYGIKYGSNWQVKLNNRDVKDGNDEALSAEPEQIKAFRDTWELGIHSYLSYLRDRLLIAKDLLTDSGSCFVQISDENVHLVRCLMDEVFGSENFCREIIYRTKSPLGTTLIGSANDFIIWYAKNKLQIKYRDLFANKTPESNPEFSLVEEMNGTIRNIKTEERINSKLLPYGAKILSSQSMTSSGRTESCVYDFEYNGKTYSPGGGKSWGTNKEGMKSLLNKNRLVFAGNGLRYKYYLDDFPVMKYSNLWVDTFGEPDKKYVVQTTKDVIQRCLLMTTDPGDLVLDPTCGSGTTAFVAEQWGRRWITIDTSRIALNIAKTRLMTAVYPYYKLYDPEQRDLRQGFIYKTVPHITLKSLANDEPPATETLFDQPEVDKKVLRVSGPFTVETLQNYEPIAPELLDDTEGGEIGTSEQFEEIVRQHLLSTGIKNGRKNEMVLFKRIDLLSNEYLHAEGFYGEGDQERKAYFYLGPKFGTVSKQAVNEAIKACRNNHDADWLVILGFSFESDIEGGSITTNMGKFEVTKCRIHDDLLQDGLKKKPAKSAASFVTIGEPDLELHRTGDTVKVEIKGLDIYDPIKDEVKARNLHEIAYWMVDHDYDYSSFVVKQVFFCGGDKNEFDKVYKGLDAMSKESTKRKAEKTLKIEIDDEAFDRLYGHISHPIKAKKGQRIAVRIVSQFGEECTKVLTV